MIAAACAPNGGTVITNFRCPVDGSRYTDDYGPRGNPLLGSTALFFIPAMLMATISPYAVRLRAQSVEGIGSVAGMLYALSTLAQMIMLRGAETVIVGIQPEVAFAMVQLGLTLSGVATALDLEEGLAYLTQRGKRGERSAR